MSLALNPIRQAAAGGGGGGEAALPPMFFRGLDVTFNVSDFDHDIDVATGECRDEADSVDLVLESSLTKQIDAAWAAGTNQGGMFTGSVASSTWYHVFLIRKDSDGSLDVGFDTNVNCANIPTGYTEYRWLWAVLTNSSSNLELWRVHDGYCRWSTVFNDVSTTSPPTSFTAATSTAPPGLITETRILSHIANGGRVYLKDGAWGAPESDTRFAYATTQNDGGSIHNTQTERVLTSTSRQIYYAAANSDDNIVLRTLGWQANRRLK